MDKSYSTSRDQAENEEPKTWSHDLIQTCPTAKWTIGEKRADFGIPGFPVCGFIESLVPEEPVLGWHYLINCPLVKQIRRGRRDDRGSCLAEAERWLDVLGCPRQRLINDPARRVGKPRP
jgi:hypothetical protein